MIPGCKVRRPLENRIFLIKFLSRIYSTTLLRCFVYNFIKLILLWLLLLKWAMWPMGVLFKKMQLSNDLLVRLSLWIHLKHLLRKIQKLISPHRKHICKYKYRNAKKLNKDKVTFIRKEVHVNRPKGLKT